MDEAIEEFLKRVFSDIRHLPPQARYEKLLTNISRALDVMDLETVHQFRAEYLRVAADAPVNFALGEDTILTLIDGNLALREIEKLNE